ncbi:sigma-70 family RNA polymerase sigma factor [Streptomyces cocklensis]|jgi:RNA polymerase sigma-70 factor (ECF subfamily)|nr:sigma-70 family RNA polymerase sigma factor [Actinacidiphila cocklensis]MDD1061374.1 sigma-70 family RNA polymerase sigma factor [Actinacidiphila cocklensis]WSX76786.1 sigma-70 family RNA polymerase sigma factor [Streptomyces sp. NBC_00899]
MNEHDWLVERFETDRPRLRAVAYRMLGSLSEADDAVQEAWIRLSRADVDAVENLSGWLTTIVARVSLNMLKSRKSRREDLVDAPEDAAAHRAEVIADPEQEAMLADSVGLALLVVLDTLTPAERLAFVLHDMFAVPYEEIAPIVDRTPAAARQLASRARRRVQQAGAGANAADAGARGAGDDTADAAAQAGRADLVRAFLAASREGEFEALLAVLDPDIVLRTDDSAIRMADAANWNTVPEVHGADAVTRAFLNRTWSPVTALVDGSPGLVWAHDGAPRVVFRFAIDGGRIAAIDVQADLAGIDIVLT